MNPEASPTDTDTHPPPFTPPSHPTPNHAWGDRMPLLTKTDTSSTLRIAFQNARGIYCNQNWSTWTLASLAWLRQTFIGPPNVYTNLPLLQTDTFLPQK